MAIPTYQEYVAGGNKPFVPTISNSVSNGVPTYKSYTSTPAYKKFQVSRKFDNYESLPLKQKYDTLREARDVGVITQKQHTDEIMRLGSNEQSRIQQDAGKNDPWWQKAADTITDFTTRPIIDATNTVGNSIAASTDYLINELNGTRKKRQQDILDSIKKEGEIRAEFMAKNPMASLEAEQKATQGQRNITAGLRAMQRENIRYQEKNNDPIKTLGAATVLGTTIALPGVGKMAGALGRLGTTPALTLAGKVAGGALEGMTTGGLLGSAYQASQTGSKTTPEQNKQAALGGMSLGGVIGAGSTALSEKLSSLATKKASELKITRQGATESLMPELTTEQANKLGQQTVEPITTTPTTQVTKTVKIPKLTETPIIGEKKITGSALKVEAKAVEKGLTEKFPDKAVFGTSSYADDAVKAVDIAHNNPTQGWDILSGKADSTPSMRSSVFEAMSKRMTKEGDVVGLQKLAKSKYNTNLSESAQLLGAKGYNADPYSAVDAISQVSKDKITGLERRTNIRVDAVKQEAGSIVAKATKIPTKKDWSAFIESIKC